MQISSTDSLFKLTVSPFFCIFQSRSTRFRNECHFSLHTDNMRYSLLSLLFIIPLFASAQVKTVPFDVIRNQLNSGMPLPAEESFNVKGILPAQVRLVQLDIHRGRQRKEPDFSYHWKAPFDFKVEEYEIYVAEPLRSNKRYTFTFSYYKPASANDLLELREALYNNLSSYLHANYQVSRSGFSSLNPRRTVMNNLNQIVVSATRRYEHFIAMDFPGFSDIVRQKIEQLEKVRMRDARFNVFGGRKNLDSVRVAYANQQIEELINMVKAETDQYLSRDMLVLADRREITEFETERLPSYLPVNVGFGGAYFSGNFENLDYGSAPYVGVSIPLGNRTFKRYLGNASISTGIMLLNMQNASGETVSGPLIERPIYAALGYKFLNFFRFQAGATVTSVQSLGGTERINVYPFVGLSFEFDLNIRLNNQR